MAGRKPGTNVNSDPSTCMVVGCERQAIYRNPTHTSKPGYCREHKSFALPRGNVSTEKIGEYMLAHYGDRV